MCVRQVPPIGSMSMLPAHEPDAEIAPYQASSDPLERYLLPDTAQVGDDGALMIGGVSLVEIAKDFGTPCFVYDQTHLENRLADAKRAFPDGVSYASKAFLCKEMAHLVAQHGVGLDVASGGELYLAVLGGMDPQQITFHGNNKSVAELELALRVGVERIVVDSEHEFDTLERVFASPRGTSELLQIFGIDPSDRIVPQLGELPGAAQVLVRLNAGIEAETHEYVQTGQADSKFGLSVQTGAAQQLAARIHGAERLHLVGVHTHIGSQIFDVESFAKAIHAIAPLLDAFALDELCIGGGLGVPYVAGEPKMSLEEWGNRARQAAIAAGLSESTRLTAEPGRAITASAAITLYEVGTIKDLPGIRTYVAVDGGMSDNPRPILYGSGYEAFLPRAPFAERPKTVTIVGKHCESGDRLVVDGQVPSDLQVGDILATPVSGAYGHSMASNYNAVPRPPVIFVKDGVSKTVVRRETFADLARRG